MVCMQQTAKTKQTKTTNTETTPKTESSSSSTVAEMDFEEDDRLQLQHLAGGDLVAQPPLYSPMGGEYLFVLKGKVIEVFSTSTGEKTRQLLGSTSKLISMELELKDKLTLVACTETGEVLRWQWRTGSLDKKVTLNLPSGGEVGTFNLLNMYGNSETACAFVTVKYANDDKQLQQWFIVDTSTGNQKEVALHLKLKTEDPLVAVESKNFNFIAIVQGSVVHFVNCKTWKHSKQRNAHKVPITVVRAHPTEDVIATGDEVGKVFLWRNFLGQKSATTSLYHWHHTCITSLAFSSSGSSFYSSGLEGVLVRWNVQNPKLRHFIPRMCAIIRHIVVSEGNTQVAVCTADNGVQIVGTDNQLKSTLQEFTYVMDDKTGKSKFPVGLRLNPRTNALVLNGRVGHLQFYSVYTRNLLYNMDIVLQNRLSMETDKILYNIRVTKAAFNIDWMATGEVFNDEEHLPELRLKFWKYEEKTQSYSLNTNIELPHEGGFKAIEFSNDYQVDNLLCATVGEDNTVKMWSLEESDNIYKTGKVWYCIAQTSYKHMPIESICFSQDGSLLAAGFGNTLCVYKADTLKLKAALTGSVGFDGCVQKAQVRIAKQQVNGAKNEIAEQRKKIMQLFGNLLDSNDEALIKEIRKSLSSKKKQATPEEPLKPLDKIDEKQKASLYSGILQMHELNLFQKVLLYQKLGIGCQVHPQMQTKMASYLNATVTKSALKGKTAKLHKQLHSLNVRDRFKAKYRLQQYTKRQRNYDADITQHLVPILSVLSLSENSTQPQLTKSPKVKVNGIGRKSASKKIATDTAVPPRTQQIVAEISRVQFAAGEHAHLVVVCTETRVLVWNLLTLRLQSVFKLSVQHLAFDAQTNLLAAFTKNNELHVFQPNVPLPLYQRRNLPKLFGAVWLPRRQQLQRSLNLDWQAQSILYFLTEKQEIMYLGSPKDVSSSAHPPITFAQDAVPEGLRYSTFGTFATQKTSDKELVAHHKGPLILGNSGKTAVSALIDMSTHTMPPLSLLCGDFVRSLVKPAESSTPSNNKSTSSSSGNSSMRTNGGYDEDGDVRMNGNASHSDSDNEGDADVSRTLKVRKSILAKNEELSQNSRKEHKTLARNLDPNSEEGLRAIVALNLKFNFSSQPRQRSKRFF